MLLFSGVHSRERLSGLVTLVAGARAPDDRPQLGQPLPQPGLRPAVGRPQQYPPDALVGKDYYRPTSRGAEAPIAARLAKLRAIVRREPREHRSTGSPGRGV